MNDSDSKNPQESKLSEPELSDAPEYVPVSIERDRESGITIRWSDGNVSQWTAAELRKGCPCATCREKKRGDSANSNRSSGLPVLSAAEARPLKIESMKPVGSYAYNIAFSDGHASGIFPFAMLRTTET